MANPKLLELLRHNLFAWNAWRRGHAERADLTGADLRGANLEEANLSYCDLQGANRSGAKLEWSRAISIDLNGANLSNASLTRTVWTVADFSNADLTGASLLEAKLHQCNLSGANLDGAMLALALFINTDVRRARFARAYLQGTIFVAMDLSEAVGLEYCYFRGPSSIDYLTFQKSKKLPLPFLHLCGLPQEFITYLPSLLNQPIEFSSCFISYSHKDEEFVRLLWQRMNKAGFQVYYAPEDIHGGKKLHEQLFEAIQMHERLLLVLSENSIQSEWVMTEIRKAREVEKKEKRRKLFPIRLCDFETLRDWTCFDADTGKDLAVEVREYFIPDFSNWKDHDAFEAAFVRLQKDLKAENVK